LFRGRRKKDKKLATAGDAKSVEDSSSDDSKDEAASTDTDK
jgi:hypothetical protein